MLNHFNYINTCMKDFFVIDLPYYLTPLLSISFDELLFFILGRWIGSANIRKCFLQLMHCTNQQKNNYLCILSFVILPKTILLMSFSAFSIYLNPLCRSNQTILLRSPAAEDYGSSRAPPTYYLQTNLNIYSFIGMQMHISIIHFLP